MVDMVDRVGMVDIVDMVDRVGKVDIVLIVDIVDMMDTVDSLDMGPFQLSRWGTRGSGCSRHHCLSRRCCPLIKKMVVVLTMKIICRARIP